MKYITLEQLLAKKACKEQVELFKQHFPSGNALVTIKRARALSSVFDFQWAADNLLTPAAQEAYEAVRRSALEAYEAVRRSALEAYEAVERLAWEDYMAVKRPAREAYNAARAAAFALAYLSMEAAK